MSKAKNKTVPTGADVKAFIENLESEKRREQSQILLEMMEKASGEPGRMWGASMVGFGSYHYKYESGREGEGALTAFSPRKQSLTVYIMPGFEPFGSLMEGLGKYKVGKSCLYINKLEDVDLDVLAQLIQQSTDLMRERYPANNA